MTVQLFKQPSRVAPFAAPPTVYIGAAVASVAAGAATPADRNVGSRPSQRHKDRRGGTAVGVRKHHRASSPTKSVASRASSSGHLVGDRSGGEEVVAR